MNRPSPRRGVNPRRHVSRAIALGVASLVGVAGSPLGMAHAASDPAISNARTSLISVSSAGLQGSDYRSEAFAVSASGRYVAFTSAASNLVPGDTNETWDVFVRDRWVGTTTRISESSTGAQANSSSYGLTMTPDGRYVVFASDATNLVRGDTNGALDAFLWDRRSGMTSRISVSNTGGQVNASSYEAVISGDGRYVAFSSDASDVVAGDTNQAWDVFVRDRVAGTTRRVSLTVTSGQSNSGSASPAISADGRYVTFASDASNLVRGDTNNVGDIFVRDQWTNSTSRVSLSTGGGQANSGSASGGMSVDGRHVVFTSEASNLVRDDTNSFGDIFVRDLWTNTTSRVSVSTTGDQSNEHSYGPAMNADGRYITFTSDATNLAPGDTNSFGDIFVRDLWTNTTSRVNLSATGDQSNEYSYGPAINSDGRYIAFSSYASNLVASDTNNLGDVFLRDRLG
jgi:TolB protein